MSRTTSLSDKTPTGRGVAGLACTITKRSTLRSSMMSTAAETGISGRIVSTPVLMTVSTAIASRLLWYTPARLERVDDPLHLSRRLFDNDQSVCVVLGHPSCGLAHRRRRSAGHHTTVHDIAYEFDHVNLHQWIHGQRRVACLLQVSQDLLFVCRHAFIGDLVDEIRIAGPNGRLFQLLGHGLLQEAGHPHDAP